MHLSCPARPPAPPTQSATLPRAAQSPRCMLPGWGCEGRRSLPSCCCCHCLPVQTRAWCACQTQRQCCHQRTGPRPSPRHPHRPWRWGAGGQCRGTRPLHCAQTQWQRRTDSPPAASPPAAPRHPQTLPRCSQSFYCCPPGCRGGWRGPGRLQGPSRPPPQRRWLRGRTQTQRPGRPGRALRSPAPARCPRGRRRSPCSPPGQRQAGGAGARTPRWWHWAPGQLQCRTRWSPRHWPRLHWARPRPAPTPRHLQPPLCQRWAAPRPPRSLSPCCTSQRAQCCRARTCTLRPSRRQCWARPQRPPRCSWRAAQGPCQLQRRPLGCAARAAGWRQTRARQGWAE